MTSTRTLRIPMISGDEHDLLTDWRRMTKPRAGVARKAKRSYNRRLRHTAAAHIAEYLD